MHGIQIDDRGLVYGVTSTWHGLPQYICRPDQRIMIEDALDIGQYPIVKEPLYRERLTATSKEYIPVPDAYCLSRHDTESVLVPMVGNKFTIVQNDKMVRAINNNLLLPFPELQIDSVGTLFSGATFFMNLRLDEYQITGDKSPTMTCLLYANPLGRGSYVTCMHSTRIVCNNTERIAEGQGAANKTLSKFKHTASAEQKVTEALVSLAELKTGMKAHQDKMNFLAGEDLDIPAVDELLEKLFPVKGLDPKKQQRTITIAENNRKGLLAKFEGRKHREQLTNPYTKYGFFQAYTDWLDHEATSRNMDDAAVRYDGIMGSRADKKQAVLDMLIGA